MISAQDAVRIVCGESVLEIGPQGIVISAPSVTVKGGDTVSVQAKDASLKLEKNKAAIDAKEETVVRAKRVAVAGEDTGLELASSGAKIEAKKNVALISKGASVTLDDNASIDGSKVKLKSGSGSAGSAPAPEPDALATSWIDVELLDQDDQPVPGARYEVLASGKTITGTLDDKGRARVPIRPGSAKVTFPDFDGAGIKPA
jgi:hypothetical protein